MKINSQEENEFVLNLVNKLAPSLKQIWIGLEWNSRLNAFVWYDHSVPTFTKWAPQEPNGNAMAPCSHMWTGHEGSSLRASGDWNDLSCWHPGLPCGLVCKRLPQMLSQLHSRSKPKVECSGKIKADSGSKF